jgi:hypothetical protein
MSKFTCTNSECPNNGFTYETVDDGGFMVCGGCQTQVDADE